MNEYFAELISRRLDNDLTETEQDELYAHLAECPECRKLAEDMLLISSLADESLVEPPDTLSASVMRSVKAEKSRRKRLIPGLGGVLAASIAVVLLVRGGYFGGSNDGGIPESNNISAQTAIAEDAGVEEDELLSAPDLDEPQIRSTITGGASTDNGGEDVSMAVRDDATADGVVMDTAAPIESGDAATKRAESASPTAAPASGSEGAPKVENSAVSSAAYAGTSAQQYDTDAAPLPEPAQPVESYQLKMALMSVPVSPDSASNSLNVSANRLNVDRSDMVAVSYNGNRVEPTDPGFSDLAGTVFGQLSTFELNESDDAEPSVTTEYVVEYADGHSETLLYSSDGYLNCNGVWYKLDTPQD